MMEKKFKYNFMYGMGWIGLLNLFFSLVWENYGVKEMQMSFCLGIALTSGFFRCVTVWEFPFTYSPFSRLNSSFFRNISGSDAVS